MNIREDYSLGNLVFLDLHDMKEDYIVVKLIEPSSSSSQLINYLLKIFSIEFIMFWACFSN